MQILGKPAKYGDLRRGCYEVETDFFHNPHHSAMRGDSKRDTMPVDRPNSRPAATVQSDPTRKPSATQEREFKALLDGKGAGKERPTHARHRDIPGLVSPALRAQAKLPGQERRTHERPSALGLSNPALQFLPKPLGRGHNERYIGNKPPPLPPKPSSPEAVVAPAANKRQVTFSDPLENVRKIPGANRGYKPPKRGWGPHD
jgi:hypothetical protein